MEPMTEAERAGFLFAMLLSIMFFGTIWYSTTTVERMALQGFMPYRMVNDNTLYWLPIPKKEPRADLLRGF